MNKRKYVLNIFVDKIASEWKILQFSSVLSAAGSITVVLIFAMLFLATGCQNTSFTPAPPKALNLPISENTVSNLVPLKEWELYTVNSIAWARDSSAFVATGENNDKNSPNVFAFNIENPVPLWSQQLQQPTTFSLTYSPDNETIIIPYFAGFSRLDATTGHNIKGFDVPYATSDKLCFGNLGIEFGPDGKNIIMLDSALEQGYTTLNIWDPEKNQCVGKLVEQSGIAFGFDLSRDDKFLALGLDGVGKNYEQQVHIWDLETHQQVCSFDGAHPVSITSDGKVIANASIDTKGNVDLWDRKSCQIIGHIQRKENISPSSLAFSSDGQLLAIGGKNTLQIWRVASRELLFEYSNLKNRVGYLAFSPNGSFLLSSTDRVSIEDNAIITLWAITEK